MNDADSEDTAEVEITFSNDTNCQIQFLLSGKKDSGGTKLECNVVACPSGIDSPQHVRIRQDGDDGWFIENIEIQTYPGSLDFITYSLDGQIPQFWVDGDTGNSAFPYCSNGKWCDLKIVDLTGNPFHITIIA